MALRAATALLIALAGCKAFDESLLHRDGGGGGDSGPPADGGADAESSDAGEACMPRHPPSAPAGSDTTGVERIWALRNVLLSQGEGWRGIGYDLDDLCSTGPGATFECQPPNMDLAEETDGEDGIDNVVGHRLIRSWMVFGATSDLEPDIRSEQTLGNRAVVVRIMGWNGLDDDPVVRVVLSGSAAIRSVAAGESCPADPSAADVPAAWDGNDCVWSDVADFLGGNEDTPRQYDEGGWVAGRTLVMSLRDRIPVVLVSPDRSLDLRLTDGVFTARISADGRTLEEATLAGRWSIVDILDTYARLGFCPGSEDRMFVAEALNDVADIRSAPGSGGKGAVCDALSIGIRLDGTAVRWGGLAPASPLPTPCAGAM